VLLSAKRKQIKQEIERQGTGNSYAPAYEHLLGAPLGQKCDGDAIKSYRPNPSFLIVSEFNVPGEQSSELFGLRQFTKILSVSTESLNV
jgi:hypothetical protein